jgi:predicted ATP-grasp superfamily ATP-dependent carboligase
MDKLAKRLRNALQGVQVQTAQTSGMGSRPASFWWLSSLTGVAVAVAIIVAINVQAPEPGSALPEPDKRAFTVPVPAIEWQAKSAVFTESLQKEIDNLQSDLEKAEEAVKQDIERLF